MTGPEAAARAVLVEACHRLDRLGLVHATAGNVSMRLGPVVLATPAGSALGTLDADDVARVTLDGEPLDERQATSELKLHLALYRDLDVGAVVHTHSPCATALGYLGRPFVIDTDEARMSLGEVPCVPYQPPGTAELAEDVAASARAAGPDRGRAGRGALLLERHGVVAWAGDLSRAMALAEMVEGTARLLYIRQTWGGHA